MALRNFVLTAIRQENRDIVSTEDFFFALQLCGISQHQSAFGDSACYAYLCTVIKRYRVAAVCVNCGVVGLPWYLPVGQLAVGEDALIGEFILVAGYCVPRVALDGKDLALLCFFHYAYVVR